MRRAVIFYVRYVEAVNRVVGRVAMYMIFAMLGVLLYSSIMKTFFLPALWTLETAQFLMAAYYMLGGAYSMQLGSHVRMDLIYSHMPVKRRAFADTITSVFLLFYLLLLLYGGYSSTEYAVKYTETSYSSWAPYMAPIKIIMVIGIVLMVLQTIATFFKDIAAARGLTVEGKPLDPSHQLTEAAS